MTDPVSSTVLLIGLPSLAIGIPLSSVVETMRPLPVELPASALPSHVLGLAVIRGAKVLVIDLATLLGHGTSPATRLVTIRTRAGVVALAVTWVAGLRKFESREFEALLPLLLAHDTQIEDDLRDVLERCHILPEGGS